MKSTFKWLLILSLGIGLLALLAGSVLWHEMAAQPDLSISVNGENVDMQGLDGGSWLGLVFGVLVAGFVVCIILPLVLLLGLGLPLLLMGLVLGFVVIGALSLGAMLFSPFILLALLLWWLLRTKKPAAKPLPDQASISA